MQFPGRDRPRRRCPGRHRLHSLAVFRWSKAVRVFDLRQRAMVPGCDRSGILPLWRRAAQKTSGALNNISQLQASC
jgi:hypothetical protein